MPQDALKRPDVSLRRTSQLLHLLLRDVPKRDFAVELWDGTKWPPDRNQFCRFTWKINDPDVLKRAFQSSNRQVALGEAYIHGEFDIVGDIEGIFPLTDHLLAKKWTAAEKLRLATLLGGFSMLRRFDNSQHFDAQGKLHSKRRDAKVVQYHYDVSNDFYALWLDRNMQYSSAYFESPSDDLDAAQLEKLDRICQKLQLAAGEHLLDIGCGWGGLIIHAAENYGAEATGITLSEAQEALAKERIQAAGLADRCHVQRLDYRDVEKLGSCDKLVSIGMVEHVGESNLPEYFQRAFNALRPGGLFLCSGIGIPTSRAQSDEPAFTDVYVFPDGELVPISTTLANAESAGFEVREVENWREHYALTTRHWLRRLEAHASEAREIAGEERYRIWRLYLAGSTYYFQKSWLDLYQTLLRKNSSER